MTNSEARKRMQAQNPPESAASIDSSPAPAPVDPATIPGPCAANLGDGANGLSEDERAQVDERVAADLWGYYLHFEPTGVPEVDRILSAIGLAAKAFHHTDNWNDDLDWDYGPIAKGQTCADFIQRAANDAAALVREHTERAWDEGMSAEYDFERGYGDDFPTNPYRAARQEQNRG